MFYRREKDCIFLCFLSPVFVTFFEEKEALAKFPKKVSNCLNFTPKSIEIFRTDNRVSFNVKVLQTTRECLA